MAAEVNLNNVNFDGRNLGHVAAAEGHSKIIQLLADCGRYNFNVKDRWGKSALDIIRWSDKFEVSFIKGIVACVENKDLPKCIL